MWLANMRWLLLSSVVAPISLASAQRMLEVTSLNSCQQDSAFTAEFFNFKYWAHNNSAEIDIRAFSGQGAEVTFDISASAYGYEFLRETINPCDLDFDGENILAGMCPMFTGPFDLEHTFRDSDLGDSFNQIPSIAYDIPDLDAMARIYLNRTDTGESIACLEVMISNGMTVDLLGVKWATAVVAVLALIVSAVISGLGHLNAAAHIAANSLSLFGYFQAQAMIGLTSVPLPPIAQGWTQNFQWSMGIINVGWMQDSFTWYQRATGGTASDIFGVFTPERTSVQVQKRGLEIAEAAVHILKRSTAIAHQAISHLSKRSGNIVNDAGSYVVFGIQRAAYKAEIETTNLFMTGLTFFCVFAILSIIVVAGFKGFCELAVRQKWIGNDKFLELRNGWRTILKGVIIRVLFIGMPQMAILCLWEFTQNDSPAMIVLAVFFLLGIFVNLAWGAAKVILLARRSITIHSNPAYILFSDPQVLNRWGFLYIQFRASAYYFVVPFIIYIAIKAMFIGLGQRNMMAQTIGLIIVEAAALIGASVLRPWMDKSTNTFNIAICAINFINTIFLLLITNVFDAPAMVVSVTGVVLFFVNAVFALILLLSVIFSTCRVLFRKDPDARYQFMADDRASFMKSSTHLNTTTELDALAATARGDGGKSRLDLDDYDGSMSGRPFSPGPR